VTFSAGSAHFSTEDGFEFACAFSCDGFAQIGKAAKNSSMEWESMIGIPGPDV